MKRIGIVSDSHGMRGMLEQSLIKLEAGGPLDALIHCGDLEGSEDYIPEAVECPCFFVSGRTDRHSVGSILSRCP